MAINQTLRPLRRCITSKPAENVELVETAKETEQSKENTIVLEQDIVTIITINRPEKKNCLDVATAEKLSEALDAFENDESSKVCVLHGVGGNFCSGYDLSEIAKYDGENESGAPQFGTLANKLELSSKPVIAALSGYTIGAGFELALMCDIRLIDETTIMGFLNRRFGIPILTGGTVRLPALIGYSRAMYMILTGQTVDARTAVDWGLAIKSSTCGTSLGQATNLAKSLLKFPQQTLRADRASTRYAAFQSKQLEEALQFEKDNAAHLLIEEGVPGAKKFTEQRIGRGGKTTNLTEKDTSIRELSKDLL